MAEPQAPEIDQPAAQATDRWAYVLTEPVEGVHDGYTVHLSKPTDAQLLVLLRLIDNDAPIDAVRLYGDVLEALMDSEKREGFLVQRGLAKGHLNEDHFSEMGPAVIRHYFPEVENREQRRAAARATRRPKR